MRKVILPSILACDPCYLLSGIDIVRKHGLSHLHIDIMDGVFVPNITFGQGVVRRLRETNDFVLDVHLMVEYPDRLIDSFVDAGADMITVHHESQGDIASVLKSIRHMGCRAGIAINPGTSVDNIVFLLPIVDYVLVMSVEPGKCGQAFIPIACAKIKTLADLRAKMNLHYNIAVDGGINSDTAKLSINAGAEYLVTGSSFFKDPEKFIHDVSVLT